jgi:hypothetical protein
MVWLWFELIQKNSKGNWESALCTWAQPAPASGLAWLMGWLGLGWQPTARAEELRPTALGGGARSIPANRRRGEAGKPGRSKLVSSVAQFWGQKRGVLTGVGLSTASTVGRTSSTVTAWPAGWGWRLTGRRGLVRRWGPHGMVAEMEEDRRQRCAWRHSRQLGRRGVVGDRPEERSMVLWRVGGSTVVSLGWVSRSAEERRWIQWRLCGTAPGTAASGWRRGRASARGKWSGCMAGT